MHGLGATDGPGFPDREADRWGPLAAKLKSADAVFCVDQTARTRLAALAGPVAGGRVQVVHMGVDVDRFSPARRGEHDEFTVLFVGRLAAEKSLETLVAGFAAMAYDGPRRLIIVGEGPRESALRAAIHDQGLDALVELRPRTSQEDLPDVYRGADVFAMTRRSEGIPVVLMEAMACEVPVVATEVGGIPEIVHDERSGLLVPSGDVSAVAYALDRLAKDPFRRLEMGRAGRETVLRSFDAGKNAAQLSAELERLVAAPGSAGAGL
jgi:glycosyltransferase involved in cell wall biosynthesis